MQRSEQGTLKPNHYNPIVSFQVPEYIVGAPRTWWHSWNCVLIHRVPITMAGKAKGGAFVLILPTKIAHLNQ